MEQSKSPDRNLLQHGELAWLADKMKDRSVVIRVIPEKLLSVYSKIGSQTDFKVKKIAGKGEAFPQRRGNDIVIIKVQEEDFIAVSIERLGTQRDHSAFWSDLQQTEEYRKWEKEVLFSSKPAAKS